MWLLVFLLSPFIVGVSNLFLKYFSLDFISPLSSLLLYYIFAYLAKRELASIPRGLDVCEKYKYFKMFN